MRVLVIGGTGMLGHKVVQVLRDRFDVSCTIRASFASVERFDIFSKESTIENVNVEDIDSVAEAIKLSKPNVVINCVGVIKQLPSSKDVVKTLTINSIFPHQLASLAEPLGFRLITVSTDCVFAGSKGMYTEKDPADALDLYGRSKQLGEVMDDRNLTIRTSIIGREIGTAHSLIEWFLHQKGSVKGFVNAIYSGFPTVILAEVLADVIAKHPGLSGLYHVSSEPINKFDLLSLVKERMDVDIEIERFEDFRLDRSLDSTRFRTATGFEPLPWRELVDRMFSDPTPYEDWHQGI
jgi:dTDP-4-dehydrorhamnose reductase